MRDHIMCGSSTLEGAVVVSRGNVTVIRADLPTPDAVIVRCPNGRTYLVADHRLSDELIYRYAAEAPTLNGGGIALG